MSSMICVPLFGWEGGARAEERLRACPQAPVERRFALVIGNTDYQAPGVTDLPGATRDAQRIRDSLVSLPVPFQVRYEQNLTLSAMKSAFDDFGKKLEAGSVGLIYYAGHAFQLDGQNYLLPVDIDLATPVGYEPKVISASKITASAEEAPSRLNIIILDACQGNPFTEPSNPHARAWQQARGEPTIKGLARTTAYLQKTVVAYATADGTPALDTGAYAHALADQMRIAGAELSTALQAVKAQVYLETHQYQSPIFVDGRTPSNFYFWPRPDPAVQSSSEAVEDLGIGGLGDELVEVHGGTFSMGEMGRRRNVTVCDFAIGRTEVSQELYQSVIGTNPSRRDHQNIPTVGAGLPVVDVSWCDAVRMANSLSAMAGRKAAYTGVLNCEGSETRSVTRVEGADGYRLPSEAEWEYAARAGVKGRFAWEGTAELACQRGNVRDRPERGPTSRWGPFPCTDSQEGPAPVALFPANPWGIYGMVGNTSEWIADWYGESEATIDPRGARGGRSRVLRGGSWLSNRLTIDAGARGRADPRARQVDIGIRFVAEIRR